MTYFGMDYDSQCRGCGGTCLSGEGLCDRCRSDNKGGLCALDGCTEKAGGSGICAEHQQALDESYRRIWNETYCKHGTPRDLGCCGQCEAEQDFCPKCGAYWQACFCGANMSRENARLAEEMLGREACWYADAERMITRGFASGARTFAGVKPPPPEVVFEKWEGDDDFPF